MTLTRRKAWRPLACALLGATLVFGGCGGDSDATPSVRVETTEMRFTPARLVTEANQDVVIVVDNRGDVDHTFSINELDVEVKLNPGERKEITLNAAPNTYAYVCRILDHEGLGMVGELVVS
ncbi:MAG TPA: cupredoxin domain-containing protein [Acidimicrobiales bacterium]|nr:cupredoxin domain-containing protein [Acidimicrobiales bacterium]